MSSWSKVPSVEAKYSTLEEAPLIDENGDSELDLSIPRHKTHLASCLAGLRPQLPWVLSAVLFVLLSASWAFRWSNECSYSSFERGFNTELSTFPLP